MFNNSDFNEVLVSILEKALELKDAYVSITTNAGTNFKGKVIELSTGPSTEGKYAKFVLIFNERRSASGCVKTKCLIKGKDVSACEFDFEIPEQEWK